MSVPRVVTGAAVVDAVIPVLTSYTASAFSGILMGFTDEVAQLLALALMFYVLVMSLHEIVQYWARNNDKVIDGYERYILYVIQLVQWFLFFLVTSLLFQWLTRFIADYMPMPWYELVALGSVLIMVIIAYVPRTIMTVVSTAAGAPPASTTTVAAAAATASTTTTTTTTVNQ